MRRIGFIAPADRLPSAEPAAVAVGQYAIPDHLLELPIDEDETEEPVEEHSWGKAALLQYAGCMHYHAQHPCIALE